MQTFRHDEAPLKIFGIPKFYENKRFERLPKEIREELPNLDVLGRRCPGSRLCFRTDSENLEVKISLKTLSVDIGMSLFVCQSANVLIGDRKNPRFAGLVHPLNYEMKEFVGTFKKDPVMEEITMFLPRSEEIEYVEVKIDDGARIEEPTPYKYSKPIVYYGSSITEGIASRPSNAYSALISNRLDVDYYNLGFAGNAKGELIIADYINDTFDMSIFVLDYDYNAPTVEFLKETHEPFFKRIREKNPCLPIVMISAPDFEKPEKAQRRDVVKQTYLNAKNNGDENVYFIDGSTLFGTEDRHCCTLDSGHPNDLGAYRMAEVIQPVIKEILESNK